MAAWPGQSRLLWSINEVALIEPLSIRVGFLESVQDVAQVGPSQFSVGFPFQAGPATVVNGVVHEHSRARALSLISSAQDRVFLKSLKEVQ
ncbi:MAG: hypothetical protein CMN92_03815 [Synechococcus sp. CPC100]|nr:hypothetical protein [Synechococcus sp. CPC100]